MKEEKVEDPTPNFKNPDRKPDKPQDAIECFRLDTPMQGVQDTVCLRCEKLFSTARLAPLPRNPVLIHPYDRHFFQLCLQCYTNEYLIGSTSGQKILRERLDQEVPAAYRGRKFRDFDVSGQYGPALAQARNMVAVWAKDVQQGEHVSLYLYSKNRGPGLRGNGVGKTTLLYTAYEYLAYQTCHYLSDDRGCACEIVLPCRAVDLQKLISEFHSKRAACEPGVTPSYAVQQPLSGGGYMPLTYTFDEYRDYLARWPVLFVDDIGQGSSKMLLETAELLLDERAKYGLPTFFTSNFDLEQLEDRIGSRAVSRLRRLNCYEQEVTAPDYHARQPTAYATRRGHTT